MLGSSAGEIHVVRRALQNLGNASAGRYRDKQTSPAVQMTNAPVSDKKVSFGFPWL
jgi:hypothetical protein